MEFGKGPIRRQRHVARTESASSGWTLVPTPGIDLAGPIKAHQGRQTPPVRPLFQLDLEAVEPGIGIREGHLDGL